MALSTQTRATCLLLLVLLSLTSGSVLPPQVRAHSAWGPGGQPESPRPLGDDCRGQRETPSMGAELRAREVGTGSCSERRDGVPGGRVWGALI